MARTVKENKDRRDRKPFGFGVAIFTGFVNGIIITRLQIPAFIATLATAPLIGGLILLTIGGAPIYHPNRFYADFGNNSKIDF